MERTISADGGRRRGDALIFDRAAGRLVLGGFEATLAPGWGNRAVLEAFVALVAMIRGGRPTSSLQVRQDDLAALSAALDLDGADLRVLIEEVLQSDTGEAVGLMIRLLQHRLEAVGTPPD